ncbi:MAG: SRPBCC domain-containing protein [Flavobacteriales bacterium]|nr:SRPBCC domain-containing protein [Flavobacteriales bacterium]MBK6946583.1 SRPBCC domain-containing protein [Flavobacteriales bacterium]MBK7239679.1 SRPBCC domain-containing protein [Flavobacteriales bacterium]MBK7298702.1 SRPBCC domain-containing protein [Flavobacteriales bacterium]MBK9536634.1 SRPBCC domain-containing protein [Flavobacteriales bacterium]
MEVTTIRQRATFAASPEKVYDALMNARSHSRFTHQKARIGKKVGDPFISLDGYIDGVNLALDPGKRIVQSWRAHQIGWPELHYSQISVRLEAIANGTRMILRHERVPAQLAARLRHKWHSTYWVPLKAMLNK